MCGRWLLLLTGVSLLSACGGSSATGPSGPSGPPLVTPVNGAQLPPGAVGATDGIPGPKLGTGPGGVPGAARSSRLG